MAFETSGLHWTRSVSLRAAASLALLAASAQAQTASQIVQDTYQPPMQRMTGELVFTGAPGLAPPPGAEQLSIQLSGVSVDGALPGSEAEAEVEALLVGSRGVEAAADAGALAARLVDPLGTLHASDAYLRSLTGTLVRRAVEAAS